MASMPVSSFTYRRICEVNEKIGVEAISFGSVWRLRRKSDEMVCGFHPYQVPGFQGSSLPGFPEILFTPLQIQRG